MNKIKKIYYEILKVLPKELHYPIRIISSSDAMLKILAKKYNIKSEYYRKIYQGKGEIQSWRKSPKYPLYEEYNLVAHTDKYIFGLATRPRILINKRIKQKSNRKIAFILLHEIGHLVNYPEKYHCELTADNFASEWLDKVNYNLE